MKRVLVLLVLALICVACSSGPSSGGIQGDKYNQPDYIKDLVVYKEGDGIVIYFVLADPSMQETAWPGRVTVSIRDGTNKSSSPIWLTSFVVKTDDFQRTKVGTGAFGRERLICTIGRIKYTDFNHAPRENMGLIHLTFQGNSIQGSFEADETVFW